MTMIGEKNKKKNKNKTGLDPNEWKKSITRAQAKARQTTEPNDRWRNVKERRRAEERSWV